MSVAHIRGWKLKQALPRLEWKEEEEDSVREEEKIEEQVRAVVPLGARFLGPVVWDALCGMRCARGSAVQQGHTGLCSVNGR